MVTIIPVQRSQFVQSRDRPIAAPLHVTHVKIQPIFHITRRTRFSRPVHFCRRNYNDKYRGPSAKYKYRDLFFNDMLARKNTDEIAPSTLLILQFPTKPACQSSKQICFSQLHLPFHLKKEHFPLVTSNFDL